MNLNLQKCIENILEKHLNKQVKINSYSSLGGGCINQSYCLKTNTGDFFVKTNTLPESLEMFNTEAKGLELLASTQAVKIPYVYESGACEETYFLILEYVPSGSPNAKCFVNLAQGLAKIHQHTSEFYGLDYDNFIGSLPQSNKKHKSWYDFFTQERLLKLVKQAYDEHLLETMQVRQFEKLCSKLEHIVPEEKPALLHGDLWGGNLHITQSGDPCLIDPAVYYGHRETEIAFTTLFGGFSQKFYDAYNDFFPLEKGWKERIDVHNLYPLLVHLILFGGHYYYAIKNILNRFV